VIQRYAIKNGAVIGTVSGDHELGYKFFPLCQEGTSRKRHPTPESAISRFMPGVELTCHASGMKPLPYA